MAKFPLEMANGVQARTLAELKDNFDLEKVIGYFLDGKLQRWLDDRYYEDESEKVSQLDKTDSELSKKLCDIFDVDYVAEIVVDTEEIKRRNERIAKLKQFTDDDEIIKNIDRVAFNQEELADLYDSGVTKIYLCDGEFNIPKSKQELEYVELGGAKVEGKKASISKESTTTNYDTMDINEILNLALDYYDGTNVPKNYIKYFEILNIAALKDSSKAHHLIGKCYYLGTGVEENNKKAFEYFSKAAMQGCCEAYENLADCYLEGDGVEKNLSKALVNYKKAVDAGVESAKTGYNYCDFQINLQKASTGDISAIAELGSCYYSGSGTALNYAKAVECFEKAANQNHPAAMRNLGICYLFGYGVSKSVSTAKQCLSKAVSIGDKTAGSILESVNSRNNW